MAWATNRSRSVCARALRSASGLSTNPLDRGPGLLRGLDLVGPQVREVRILHRRGLRDQLVDLHGVAAILELSQCQAASGPVSKPTFAACEAGALMNAAIAAGLLATLASASTAPS